jgi:hypothetical protein
VKSFPETIRELWELIRSYAMQELYQPLKGLPMYIGLGVGGALSVVLGAGLILLGILRLAQAEAIGEAGSSSSTALPYFFVSACSFAGMVVLAKRINRQFREPS